MTEQVEIYHGIRDKSFTDLIHNLLARGKLKKEYIELITDESGMKIYDQAFTHDSFSEKNFSDKNYEFFEFLGDSTVNKAIVWYLFRRFPQLECPDGVKVMSRLKIALVSKKSFADFGEYLGFWDFVSCDMETRQTKMKKTLEDVFEAFFGATEMLLDDRIKLGVGGAICAEIVKSLFDEVEISLKYEDLFDAKTRLKEVFDYFKKLKKPIGVLDYDSVRDDKLVTTKAVIVHPNGSREVMGMGSGALKGIAEQNSAMNALIALKKIGIFKPVPPEYLRFCNK